MTEHRPQARQDRDLLRHVHRRLWEADTVVFLLPNERYRAWRTRMVADMQRLRQIEEQERLLHSTTWAPAASAATLGQGNLFTSPPTHVQQTHHHRDGPYHQSWHADQSWQNQQGNATADGWAQGTQTTQLSSSPCSASQPATASQSNQPQANVQHDNASETWATQWTQHWNERVSWSAQNNQQHSSNSQQYGVATNRQAPFLDDQEL